MSIPYRMTPKEWYWEIRHQIRRLLSSIPRAKRGWSRMDTWSFDRYLAGVTAGGLRQLAATAKGYPHFILEEYGIEDNDDAEALAAWKDWLVDRAEWFEWYQADEMNLPENGTKAEVQFALDSFDKKMETFKNVILADFGRHYDALWS